MRRPDRNTAIQTKGQKLYNLKVSSVFRVCALVVLGLFAACTQVRAQLPQYLYYSVSTTPSNAIPVFGELTYTISLTNQTGATLTAYTTNVLPASVQFVSATTSTNRFNDSYSVNGNVVTFTVFNLLSSTAAAARMTLTVKPTLAGSITNSITLNAQPLGTTNFDIVTQVTNTTTPVTDLGVSITGPSAEVYANDLMVYGVSVTNLGLNSVTNVFLTNTLPAGVGYYAVVSPTNQTPILKTNQNPVRVIFNLGTVTNNTARNFSLRVWPTNSGSLTFLANINASDSDTNSANDFASNNVVVKNFIASGLVATLVSPTQTLNFQNGMMEQTIRLANGGTNPVASARVMVSSLGATNKLFNAVGTNSGKPFVVYGNNLDPAQNVLLLLQFAVPNYTKFPLYDSNLTAVAISKANLSAPATPGTPVSATRIAKSSSGSVVIEFPSTNGWSYTVVYADNPSFSNALVAAPPIVAPANWTYWIDYGPPGTISHPTNSTSRFYKFYLNP